VDGTSVYFDKQGIRIPVGETDETLGVTVLSVADAPWTVKIEYRGTEFDLPLFARTDRGKLFSGDTALGGGSGGATVLQPAGDRARATPVRPDRTRGRPEARDD